MGYKAFVEKHVYIFQSKVPELKYSISNSVEKFQAISSH